MSSSKHLALVLVGVALGLGCAWIGGVSEAHAGEWVQRSCSFGGTEYIAPEGWESKDVGGYTETPYDNCERFYNGGGLRVDIAPMDDGYPPLAGQTWSYKAPVGSTIAGGSLAVHMTARDGFALLGAKVNGNHIPLAVCESPGCFQYSGDVPITAVGASEIYEQAACLSKEPACHQPNGEPFIHEGDGVFSAEAELSSAQILLSTNAVPAASGLGGSLLNSTVTGRAALTFTATDSAGPGIYQVRVKVNGEQVLAETPNLNAGKCVSTATSEGARAFNYAQPCPTETPVHAEINTAGLADGTHALTVELEDAAGDLATVYSGTLTTANHPVSPILITPTVDRGALNGNPASESAILTLATKQPRTFTRTQARSALTLTGRLTDPAGAPITGALLQVTQQVVGSATPSAIASTTTSSTGAWMLKVPKGPSRLLTVAYYSHLVDTVPAAALAFHERVKAAVSLTAPRRVRDEELFAFTGHLAGGHIPSGGESIQMELKWDGRWRTIEVLPTTSGGRWTYMYVFTAPPGAYRFRAVALPNGSYPFLSSKSYEVTIRVR
jgi:hypothetical protein